MSTPQPQQLTLLILTLPGILLLSWELLRGIRSGGDKVILLPGVAVAAFLVTSAVASRITGSSHSGLASAGIVLCLGGLWIFGRGLSLGRAKESEADRQSSAGEDEGRVKSPLGLMILTALLATVPVSTMAFNGFFHDELIPDGGHFATIAQLQNGVFAPRVQSFPDRELPYHYGFALLCATLTGTLRISVPHAIDLVTTAMWFYSWCLLWILGERLFPGVAGLWPAVVPMFGGGIVPYLLFIRPWWGFDLARIFTGAITLGLDLRTNPPTISYFFQHPFTLGIPLTLISLIVIHSRFEQSRSPVLVLGICLLGLAISQSILFIVLFASWLGAELARRSLRPVMPIALSLVAGALFLNPMLRFWEPTAGGVQISLWPLREPALRVALWHLLTFGGLLVGALMLARLRKMRVFFLLFLGSSFFVPSLFNYRFSWDIVKFSAVAAIALGILTGGLIGRLLRGERAFHKTLAWVLLATVLPSGTGFGVYVIGHQLGWWKSTSKVAPSFLTAEPLSLSSTEKEVIERLRRAAGPTDLVLCTPDLCRKLAVWGGRFVALPGRRVFVSDEEMSDRERLLLEPLSTHSLRDAGVRWILVREGDPRWQGLSSLVERGIVARVFAKGRLEIFEVRC